MCSVASDNFYTDAGVSNSYALLSANLDLRGTINSAKALALSICTDNPILFSRLEPLLNRIDNELRNERNRFVHDRWIVAGDKIVRLKTGTKISRLPSTGNIRLETETKREFATISDVSEVASRIADANRQVADLSEQIQETYRQKYHPEE